MRKGSLLVSSFLFLVSSCTGNHFDLTGVSNKIVDIKDFNMGGS